MEKIKGILKKHGKYLVVLLLILILFAALIVVVSPKEQPPAEDTAPTLSDAQVEDTLMKAGARAWLDSVNVSYSGKDFRAADDSISIAIPNSVKPQWLSISITGIDRETGETVDFLAEKPIDFKAYDPNTGPARSYCILSDEQVDACSELTFTMAIYRDGVMDEAHQLACRHIDLLRDLLDGSPPLAYSPR